MHTREDETHVIIRGHFRFWRGSEVIDAPAGTVVFLPRNVPHELLNVGDGPGEDAVTIVPAGLEQMFVTLSQRGLMPPKDRAEILALAAQYGITYVHSLSSPATPR